MTLFSKGGRATGHHRTAQGGHSGEGQTRTRRVLGKFPPSPTLLLNILSVLFYHDKKGQIEYSIGASEKGGTFPKRVSSASAPPLNDPPVLSCGVLWPSLLLRTVSQSQGTRQISVQTRPDLCLLHPVALVTIFFLLRLPSLQRDPSSCWWIQTKRIRSKRTAGLSSRTGTCQVTVICSQLA